jgi:ribosomal protein S18 acetylase RimI-like enzyme
MAERNLTLATAVAKLGKDLTAKDILAIVSDLSAAFAQYPLCKWIFASAPDEDHARRRLFEIVVREMLIDKAQFLQAHDHGVAIWIRSETFPLIERGKDWAIYRLFHRSLGASVAQRLVQLHLAMAAHHPRPPHDYLYLIGVHPNFQRRGVGTLLMRQHLAEADRMGRDCFLETSNPANVLFYSRLGFSKYCNYIIGRSSPRSWGLWRTPKLS